MDPAVEAGGGGVATTFAWKFGEKGLQVLGSQGPGLGPYPAPPHSLPGGPYVPARPWAEDIGHVEVNGTYFLPSRETDKKQDSYNTGARGCDAGGRGRSARGSPANLAWVSKAFENRSAAVTPQHGVGVPMGRKGLLGLEGRR